MMTSSQYYPNVNSTNNSQFAHPPAPAPVMNHTNTTAQPAQQEQVNVPHPYRHNPYGAHQRVYYEQVHPVGVFQHNTQGPVPAQQQQNNYSMQPQPQPQQQQQYYHHPQATQQQQQQQQQQMYSMIVPTEPGANYDPSAFATSTQQQQYNASAVNELEQFGNSVNSHYQAGAKLQPAELDTSDSINQFNGSEENYSNYQNNNSSMENSGSSTPTHHQQMMNTNNNNYVEPLRFAQTPPMGTLHSMLTGRMKFCLYPNSAFEIAEPRMPKRSMVRMFIGQLPYHVTEMQLSWLVYMFGGCSNLYFFERITKTDHTKGGIKVPTGCFHCHMEPEQVQPLLHFLNDRLLVDDTGIWVADSNEEKNFLANYCYSLKIDRTKRFQGRPYGTVVAQVATSTFDPDTFVPRKGATRRDRRQQ